MTAPPAQRPRVLVVEDDQSNRETLVHGLRRRFQVEVATNAEEALRRIVQGGIEAIVTDQRMPGLTGIQMLAVIHQQDPLPAVLVSAYHDAEEINEAIATHQVSRFLAKPFTVPDLEQAILSAIAEARSEAVGGDVAALLDEAADRVEAAAQRIEARTRTWEPDG